MSRTGQGANILVVPGSRGLGDALETFPVFELIRDSWPDARLAAGSHSAAQEMTFAMSPHVTRCVRIRAGSVEQARAAIVGFSQNLKVLREFDVVLFLYKKRVARAMILAARLAGAAVYHRHPYRYQDPRRHAYGNFPARVLNQIIVARWLGLPLRHLREPRLVLPEADRQFAEQFFREHGLGARPTVILNTLGSAVIPGWGIERYAQVANRLVARHVDVIVNAGTDVQRREVQRVAHVLESRVFLLDTRLPRQLASVIARCDLLIGEASGQSWLATALGIPMITLFGPGDQGCHGLGRGGPVWWPRDARHRVISKLDWCWATMGSRCTCRYPPRPRRSPARKAFRNALKAIGVWKLRKALWKALGLHRPRPKLYDSFPPCLAAISVDEVVEAAVRPLGGAARAADGALDRVVS
jgi:ADP-heptose:LPS heptosyltransferase